MLSGPTNDRPEHELGSRVNNFFQITIRIPTSLNVYEGTLL